MTGSNGRKVVDLRPILERLHPSIDARPPANTGFEFIDLVDDPPAPPDPSNSARTRSLTATWTIFLSLLVMSLAIGAIVTPLALVLDPFLAREHLFVTGLLIYSAAVLTAAGAYWIVRGMTARLLQRVATESPAADPPVSQETGRRRVQATEIDQLVDTVTGLLTQLRYRIDHEKRSEHNTLIRTITALATALEARDPYTQNHSRSVARLSVKLGQKMGLARENLYELHLAGLLHDIGKIGVPDEVLLKPARLTPEEVLQVQAHVEWSYTILSPIPMLGQVGLIARHHHERFDGHGYPSRLAGVDIPLGARIMAVADMFVAMTEDRPYRKGLPISAAVDELRRVAGSQVDPLCVEHFLACLEADGLIQPDEADVSESKRAVAN